MAEDQYTSSSEQERFARQLQRDLDRASNKKRKELGQDPRLSQSTINKLIRDDTSQWARQILNQKLSSNNASNIAEQSNRATTPSTSFTESPDLAPFERGSSAASSYPAIKNFPSGTNIGDMLAWNGEAWVLVESPSGGGLKVLAINAGSNEIPFWIATKDCE